ncbi:MAG: peptide chain release factor N(5)-glutamine methyltransferase [Candidatus Rokubacteria bacterium]|nr:peptide chain release factor N(5)-glutamine methyltransferase [Candidatus Rokubacteria bacterium]
MTLAGVRPTVRVELEAAVTALAAAGIETSRLDAEWLLSDLLGVGRFDLYLALERELPGALLSRYEAAIGRRIRREPLQQILGWEAFRGLRLRVTGDVLVPRPETEVLAEWALELLPPPAGRATRCARRPLVVDVGTGSGCVACALAHERPDIDVIALDASPAAARVAQENARALGLADRLRVVAADLLAPVRGRGADLIVSNLPYLPTALLPSLAPEVRDHEPPTALDGGVDGLVWIRRLVGGVPRALRPAGALVLETAGGPQATAVAELLRGAAFVGVSVRRDLAGVARFVAGRLP